MPRVSMSAQTGRATQAAAEPQQHRGRVRMNAILEAASQLFADKPYEAVTMTEIAALSKTGIGQVYRFFPTKEMLSDALLSQYRNRIDVELGLLAARSKVLSPSELADAFLTFMTGLGKHRAAVILLLDTRRNTTEQRSAIRTLMLVRIGEVLAASASGIASQRRDASAELILQMMKLAAAEQPAKRGATARFRAELRVALSTYLADVLSA